MVRHNIHMAKNLLLSFLALVLTAEIAVRLTNLDFLLLKPLLFYKDPDTTIHEISQNPERMFQLKPNSSTLTAGFKHPASANSLGFRGPERSTRKPAGVTRIICFGGSTTYGAFAGDEDTFPYQLEKTLNSYYKGKFEVWNAGVSAYVLSAEVGYAKEVLTKYTPDIIIFQHFNQGRRAFLPNAPYAQFFRSNPQLYKENLRFIPFPHSKLSLQLLEHSAAYRSGVILANCFMFIGQNNPDYDNEDANRAAFESFYSATCNHVPIFLLRLKILQDYPDPQLAAMIKRTGIRELDIFSDRFLSGQNLSSEYFMVHPPAHVYKWYARSVAGKLEEHRMIVKK